MGKSMATASYVEDNLDWRLTTTSDNTSYVIDNGSGTPLTSTKQYLAEYIWVYRTAGLTARPANTRTKKTYLVSPGEYTYDYSTATVTFLSAQSPASYIYVDIAQPYFREGNDANAICLDCHNDRTDSAVSHAPGAGGNDNHPVVVGFSHTNGLNDTLKASAGANIYIEGGQVLCTSCHDPHNAASNDGQITRNADSSGLCADCHKVNGFDGFSTAVVANHDGAKHSSATVCLDCHTTHNTTNIMLIRTNINGKTVNLQDLSGANSLGNDTGSSLCEACHTATNYHLADGSGAGHNTGLDCTSCHSHASGFKASGDCTSCHGFPPAPGNAGPAGWADATGDAHASHLAHLDTAEFGNLSAADACKECHGSTIPRGDHNTGKTTAGIDQTTWTAWGAVGGNWGATSFADAGTTGQVDTSDDTCTNVSCHSASGSRQWGGTDCDSCHSFPGSATNDWAAGNGHASRYDSVSNTHMPATGYNPTTDTYVALTSDTARCGKCHYSGSLANHMNGTVTMSAKGHADCTGTDFTINVIATGTNVTCGNVDCHRKATPNWH
jgi:predicted CxxxxCH...CXXCH cytochrome family protein